MSTHTAHSAHTPLPWHYTKAYGRNNPDWYIGKGESANPNGTPLIATVVQYEANASYIVRACNALPAVIAALSAVQSALLALSTPDAPGDMPDALLEQIASALEQAGESK